MATARGAVGAAFQPLHDVLQVAPVTAALAPHEQTFDHVMADCTHAGAAVASVTDPATAAHGPLTVATVDMQGGGGLVEAANGTTGAELDHLVGHIPEAEALQQVNVGCVPVLLVVQREKGGKQKARGMGTLRGFTPACWVWVQVGCTGMPAPRPGHPPGFARQCPSVRVHPAR